MSCSSAVDGRFSVTQPTARDRPIVEAGTGPYRTFGVAGESDQMIDLPCTEAWGRIDSQRSGAIPHPRLDVSRFRHGFDEHVGPEVWYCVASEALPKS